MNYQKNYYPRRPVKSFQDLEVYQKLLAVSVAVVKRTIDDRKLKVVVEDGKSKIETADPSSTIHSRPLSSIINHLSSNIIKLALDLPIKIAAAHSLRFSDQLKAIQILEEVMLNCNILIVYLEQYRDLENPSTSSGQVKIETEFFEEQIKSLLITRMKILHLQMSWKKFMAMKQKEQNV